MVQVHLSHVATIVLGLVIAILTGSIDAQYGRERIRQPVRGKPLRVFVESVQRGDMSPAEDLTEPSHWPLITTSRPRGPPKKPLPCEQGSCYPATGNLLIGREDRLSASSTCGMRVPERFCIVSHLKERKKCFYCNAKIPKLQHTVEKIVHKYIPGTRYETWWQSENGVENVTLRLDLEAEFHFTHIIIRFQTFRPAAMLIERSYDFGETWQVYRYFAHNCEQSFPGVSTDAPRKLTDVICESRYSYVAPSEDGEIIFRVLPPNLPIENPYSKEVQNLLKMTNLRINFTRLHTLGDDLLDNRAEIKEKYYYAIKDMVVRGSCSCYGHASRCLPLRGVSNQQDMVHGQCECTHNTKGLNCELCEDFYNDLPWKPAVGKLTNACKKCNCNNHATSCHFDDALYQRSGRVSGGVCDDCQHNTWGQNCEQCKPFYYHDVSRDIMDPEACQPCDCDPAGSLDDGICESRTDELSGDESGRCHCKRNVEGRRCDHCKNGFWNFDENNPEGCQACTCNTLGTVDNQGCNTVNGECTCKRYVTARDCNQCLPQFWGLSDDRDGCKPCDCDMGGAYDNHCDVVTGQCRCRPHISGRTCNQPEQSYYTGSLDFLIYEGEHAESTENCQVVIREPYRDGRNTSWTGTGFMRVYGDSTLTFNIDDIRKSMEYDIIVRYEMQPPGIQEGVQILIQRDGSPDPNGPCADWQPGDDRLLVYLPQNSRSATVHPSVCLEEGKRYTVLLEFRRYSSHVDSPAASILIDSIVLMPRIEAFPFFRSSDPGEMRLHEYERYHCGEIFNEVGGYRDREEDICNKYYNSIGLYYLEGAHPCECNPTGSRSLLCDQYGGFCPCKENVVGRRCDLCAPGTYGFGPEGCVSCDCDSVGALDNICDVETGRCKCRPNTYGRTCGQCEPGFWNFPHCQRCECHGHADTCDSRTGACTDCRDYTTGHNCDRCVETFYGDPRIGIDIPCRACPCPGTLESGHSYADSCSLDPVTQDVVCECHEGYAGPRCESCAENFFGDPEVPTGSCTPCDCSNNTDLGRPGNCDPHTGRCLQCLYNTDGRNCQICKAGFYGNALEQNCRDCECNALGTDGDGGPCDHYTGQCPCLPNVVGQLCDTCRENHWRIASGEGCDPCGCDSVGSVSDKCNEYEGTCECRAGFGGRQCNQCQLNHWGNPNIQCHPCECDSLGSSTQQCDRDTGACICHRGIGGEKCDHCDRGYHGNAPSCNPCGECFDNWDLILQGVGNQTVRVKDEASRIQKVGTTGVYSQEFENMEEVLKQVQDLVSNTSIGTQDLDEMSEATKNLESNVTTLAKILDEVDNLQERTSQSVNLADIALKNMKNRTNNLHQDAAKLRENATRLQEANVQGALNVTLQMAEQSKQAEKLADSTTNIIADAQRFHKNTDSLLSKNSAAFHEAQESSRDSLMKLEKKLEGFNELMPGLNEGMCGEKVEGCSDLCGGAGCGSCGGLSCDTGAVTRANQALDFAKRRSIEIKNHKDEAEQLLRSMTQAKQEASAARANAQDAFNFAWEARNRSDKITKDLSDINVEISSTLVEETATPSEVRKLAEEVLSKNIHLKPDGIKNLADDIKNIVGSLTNSEKILADTAEDLKLANTLEARAKSAKELAIAKQELAANVVVLLNDTQTAQDKAQLAIDQAEQDIKLSDKDLADIIQAMKVAQEKADNTTAKVEALDTRLTHLRTTFLKNNYTVNEEISSEAKNVAEEAKVVDANTRRLASEYRNAEDTLNSRASKSKGNIQRAKKLLQRALELTTDTTTKNKDLAGMEDVYKNNERMLEDLMQVVDALTKEMDGYLEEIERKFQKYPQCSI